MVDLGAQIPPAHPDPPMAPSPESPGVLVPNRGDDDARLVSAGRGENMAGDGPVKALGIRARHSWHADVFISDSRLLLLLAAPGRRLAREPGLARRRLSLLRSPAAYTSAGRAGPFPNPCPHVYQKPSFISSCLTGQFLAFRLVLLAGLLILQQLKHSVIFQAEFGLGCEVLMEPGGTGLPKTH